MGLRELRDEKPDSIRETGEKVVALLAPVAREYLKTGQKINGILDQFRLHGIEFFVAKDGEEFPFSFGARPGKPKPDTETE